MKELFFVMLLVFAASTGKGQDTSAAMSQKNVYSLGADLVPIASVDGTPNFGFGGSLGFEIFASPKTSFAVNAGYLLYANHPGTYGGHVDDLEFIPVLLSLRDYGNGNFYLGPKAGINIDLADRSDFEPGYRKAVTFLGGLSFGSGSKKGRLTPDFSLLYHNTSYGSIFSFQTSVRYNFTSRK